MQSLSAAVSLASVWLDVFKQQVMRAIFLFQPTRIVLDSHQRVELRTYTGDVLGAESSDVTHVSGVITNGSGRISSQTISTGQLWLRGANGATTSFVVRDGLPFTPAAGQRITVLTGFVEGRPEKETNLAIHSHAYHASYWLAGEDFEVLLTRMGLISRGWSLMTVVYAGLIITVIGIPVALAIGIWTGTGKRRTFNDLRTKALQAIEEATPAIST